jgi:hypothetical protein
VYKPKTPSVRHNVPRIAQLRFPDTNEACPHAVDGSTCEQQCDGLRRERDDDDSWIFCGFALLGERAVAKRHDADKGGVAIVVLRRL